MDVFLLTVGIGQYAGGNMKLCPEAVLDDGLFDINIIQKVSKKDLILNLYRLRDGSYLKYIDCLSQKAKKIEIMSSNTLTAEADGEFYGTGIASFEIVERKINVYAV
jgi:diacylglycerol kinase (ATP)